MDQMKAIKVFVEVVERGSFARAAHALHLATATVSEHVANLEKKLGTSLLNRTTRTVALTDNGAEYFSACKEALEKISEVETSLGRTRNIPMGALRIDVGAGIVSSLLLPVLPEFQERYPDITLQLLHDEHLFDLSQQGYDVILRSLLAPPENTRLIARPLGHTRVVLAASPEYLARHGEPKQPNDLLRHRCIGFIDPLSHRIWEWFFERDGERFSLELQHRLALSQGELRVDAALRGLGVINELYCNIHEQVRKQRLKLILGGWSYDASLIHVLYPRKRQISPKLRAFVDFMLEKYPPGKALDPPH